VSAGNDLPVRGLPDRLPPGETILWQGAPEWRALAVRAFHVRKVAAYFALLAAWIVVSTAAEGGPVAEAAGSVGIAALLGTAAIAILILLAWLSSRTTVYTITDRRVAMRIGIALPMYVNLPFRIVGSAALAAQPDGTGDIPLSLNDGRMAYFALWPHARPWRIGKPEPMLRAVPDARRVAGLLGRALAAAAGQPAPSLVEAPARQPAAAAAPSGIAAPV